MQKSVRAKSSRKPLIDISNSRKDPSKDPSAKKIAEKQHQQDQEEAKEEEIHNKDPNIISDGDKESSLDRLLLAHSDLSNLIRQIDELIVQAVELNATCKMGSQEIESFMCVVSDMQSTLKPWLPRFQQALSRPSTESDRWLGQSLLVQPESATNEERNDPKYSEELDLGSLISPSPLVSWPANCRVESGRQLFLLTPLPKMKSFSSKCPGPSKSVSEKVPHMGTPSHALSLPPLMTISADFGDDLLDSVEFEPTSTKITKSAVTLTERSNSVQFKPTSTKNTKSAVALTERSSDSSFISALQFSNQRYRDRPMLLTTPRLKMSPPKTCRYFEPVSESFQQNKNDMMKPIPLASGVIDSDESLSAEKSSSSPVSGCLASKYPELFGIQLTHKSAIKRQDVEASLDWFFSPPKTCILMEPPDEKFRTNPAGCNLFSNNDVHGEQPANMVSAMDNKICSRNQLTMEPVNHGLCSTNLAAPESTPMWKDFGSTVCKGKQPGENTLKRELWTRFEAVSASNELHFNVSLFQETEGKGFLDRLEEVSFEETGLESKNSLSQSLKDDV